MRRCGGCDWFIPQKRKSDKGYCVAKDSEKLATDKRCDAFEND